MMIRVDLPGGVFIEFPDTMSPHELAQTLESFRDTLMSSAASAEAPSIASLIAALCPATVPKASPPAETPSDTPIRLLAKRGSDPG